MERHYKAFISYRHLPTEMWAAKALHRRIERYVVPAALRKNGEKHLGLVFRDQDELPISSNLGADIQRALDNSEFLIVICSPETAKSLWVLREISYFLEHHDRDHVLAVLCYGEPRESFPVQLTERRDENGKLIGYIEPLAANIAADTQAGRARLFRTESLRILAALIGCPYDALYRRQQRYRRRRIGAALGAAALIAAAFIGLVLDRNARISAQLLQTQINEAQALAALSENALREGDYSGALDYALRALPQEDGDRPYVPQAEYALSRVLDLYRYNSIGYTQSLRQDTVIIGITMSEDGRRLLTLDAYGGVRLFDTGSGALLWEQHIENTYDALLLGQRGAVLIRAVGRIALLSLEDGSFLWSRTDLSGKNLCACAEERGLLLCSAYTGLDSAPDVLSVLDLDSGEALRAYPLSDGPGRLVTMAAFSPQGEQLAFLLCDGPTEHVSLMLLDLGSGALRELDAGLPFSFISTAYRLLFRPSGDLVLVCDDMEGDSFVRLYAQEDDWACRFNTVVEAEKVAPVVGGVSRFLASLELVELRENILAVGSKHQLSLLDLDSGEALWSQTLPAYLLGGHLYEGGDMILALSNGTITVCQRSGLPTSNQDAFCFQGNFDTGLAYIRGSGFPDSVFALVTDEDQQQVSILRFRKSKGMTPVAEPEGAARMATVSSPSGAVTACLAYDAAGTPLSVTILHEDSELPLAEWPLDADGGWEDPGLLCLSESGVLFSPRQQLVCKEGVAKAWGEGLSCLHACSRSLGEVFSAAVCAEESGSRYLLRRWRDGTEQAALPLPEDCSPRRQQAELVCVSAPGWAVVRLTGEDGPRLLCASPDGGWTELPAAGSLLTLAEDKPLLACLDGENRVRLLSLPDGAEQAVSAPLPPAAAKLLFCCDDGKLLVFSQTGSLILLDCADASLLYRGDYNRLNLYFSSERSRYEIRLTAAGDRLLIFYNSFFDLFTNAYGLKEPVCISLDAALWERVGVYEGAAAYEPGTGTLLVCPYLSPICRSPLWTLDDLLTIAQSVTAGQSGEVTAP